LNVCFFEGAPPPPSKKKASKKKLENAKKQVGRKVKKKEQTARLRVVNDDKGGTIEIKLTSPQKRKSYRLPALRPSGRKD